MSSGQPVHINRASNAVSSLNDQEKAALRVLVAAMIPADSRLEVPGADDAAIFTDILRTAENNLVATRTTLAALDAATGQSFASLHSGQREVVAQRFLDSPPREFSAFFPMVLQCYYRDDRVMRAIGMEARPPFPKGYEVEQGDWSLLDAVRARPKIWRDAD